MTMGVVQVADRAIHYSLLGSGGPLVVLEGGLGSTLSDWSAVQAAVAEFSAVFSYDRAGLGRSAPAPTPRTCHEMVQDLRAVLDAIGRIGPVVVVGHSMGGLLVRSFAARYPSDVVGMVLVDASHEDRYERFDEVLSEELRERTRRYLADPARNSEQWDVPACQTQVRESGRAYGFPLRVLARGVPDQPSAIWPSEALQKIEVELQRQTTRLSTNSRFVVAERSGHFIQRDQPELVVDAIREIVEMVRAERADLDSTEIIDTGGRPTNACS